ncbi:MAG: ATP-binding protein [Candidatus Heimdallarchaeota archaeon]
MVFVTYEISRVGEEWDDRAVVRLNSHKAIYSIQAAIVDGGVQFRATLEPKASLLRSRNGKVAAEARGNLESFLSGQGIYEKGIISEESSGLFRDGILKDRKYKHIRTILARQPPRLPDTYSELRYKQEPNVASVASSQIGFVDEIIRGILKQGKCAAFLEIRFQRRKKPPFWLRFRSGHLKERYYDTVRTQEQNRQAIEELKDYEATGAFRVEIRVVLAAKEKESVEWAAGFISGLFTDYQLQPKKRKGTKSGNSFVVSGKRLNSVLRFPKGTYRGVEGQTVSESARGPPAQPTEDVPTVALGFPRSGPILLDTPQRLSLADLKQHANCWGLTASGKTRLLIQMVRQLVELGVKVLVFDPKGEYADSLLPGNEDWLYFKVGDADFPLGLNPFAVPDYASEDDYVELIVASLRSAIGTDILTPQMEAFLINAVEYTIMRGGNFKTLFDVLSNPKVAEILDIKGKFIEDSCTALKNRLRRLISGSGGRVWNVTTSNVSMDLLSKNNVIIDMSAYEAAEDTSGRRVLLDIIAHLFYNYLAKTRSAINETGQDSLQNMILVDESQKLVPKKLTKRFTDESSLFAKLPQTVRAFGVAMMWAGVTPTVEQTVISQAGTSIVFFSKDHHDLRLMASLVGLDEEEFKETVASLQPREAIVRTPRSSAYIIRTIDTPIQKMTKTDWSRQRGKWEQENTRQLFLNAQFNMAPKFREKEEEKEELDWNFRKICHQLCLAEEQCVEVATTASKRASAIKKNRDMRRILIDDLRSSDSMSLRFVWKKLIEEAKKDSKSTPQLLPAQAFCTSVYFLKMTKDESKLPTERLDEIGQEFSRLARNDYIDYLNSFSKVFEQKQVLQAGSGSKTEKNQDRNNKTPVEVLTEFIQGNIKKYGFVTRPETENFYLSRNLGNKGNFKGNLNTALQKVLRREKYKISRVAVPSMTSSQTVLIFAKESRADRAGSWEEAVHRHFIVEIGRLCENMGHSLKSRHALPNGRKNDLCVESKNTGRMGHIEVKTGAYVGKGDFPETTEPFLIITPWESRKGKTIKVGKTKVSIPLGEGKNVKKAIKNLGSNYAVLAVDDPQFSRKLDAWIDTGQLQRALNDPTQTSKTAQTA